MFAGEYLCKVDEKGRFIVPSPIREQVESEGQAVVFLKGPEESTLIYSMKEWEKSSNGPKPRSMKTRVGCSCTSSYQKPAHRRSTKPGAF